MNELLPDATAGRNARRAGNPGGRRDPHLDPLRRGLPAFRRGGYLRLRREDYQKIDIERWSDFVREQESNWRDAFVYFKHEESGIGPKLATHMKDLLEQNRQSS